VRFNDIRINTTALEPQGSSEVKNPILSVIIPTKNRPQYLLRAITSALKVSPNNELEVIVVPNGPDLSWKNVAERFAADKQVLWHPISTGHANAARNHGLSLAKGKYIRFLDDDDYLFPSAKEQVELLESSGAELCSGRVQSVDVDGSIIGETSFPISKDFVAAAVSVTGFTLPTGNLFLKRALTGFCWNENVGRAQDYIWMLTLAGGREWNWLHLDQVVGVWFQHEQQRTSTVAISKDHPTQAIDALEQLWRNLNLTGRLTHQRAEAIAETLWDYVHWRFPFRPLYWHNVAKLATKIEPSARPDHPIFDLWPLYLLPALTVEWGIYPLRRITTFYRDKKRDLLGWDYKRHL
jgi:glycosyltransferase involved in cell wall biosynthesis